MNENIYIIQYPEGKCSLSYGKIINVEDFEISHDCATEHGSSGGPILLLKNYKVIGIHKGVYEQPKINVGTLLKEPIKEFNSIFLNKKIKNNYVNCILCTYQIKNEEEFNLLHDFSKNLEGLDIELNELYKKSKKKKKL